MSRSWHARGCTTSHGTMHADTYSTTFPTSYVAVTQYYSIYCERNVCNQVCNCFFYTVFNNYLLSSYVTGELPVTNAAFYNCQCSLHKSAHTTFGDYWVTLTNSVTLYTCTADPDICLIKNVTSSGPY